MPAGTLPSSPTIDLLKLPLLGRFLSWRHARTALQMPLFLLAVLMVFDGLTGPQLAPKNLATVFTWVHYRGALVLALLLFGNLFCMACPFMLLRNGARRLLGGRRSTRPWPRMLRGMWLALALFVLMLFAYELFDLWATPRGTAIVIVGYFTSALVVDSLFRGASFCKYLCPLGQFNFVGSLISPFTVRTRSPHACAACRTHDCIKGRQDPSVTANPPVLHGCELWLYQPLKLGNMDCTFCLDCAHACPHGNLGITARLPASELWDDSRRSGIGRFSRRPDLAALVAVFSFGALLNAFAMVSPVNTVQAWLAGALGTESEMLVLGLLFVLGLLIAPAFLLVLAGWTSWRWAGLDGAYTLSRWVTRYVFALVPLGFGVWLAHYAFHFLTGFWTFVPVVQSFVEDILGAPLLGLPQWYLGPLLPMGWLYPLELGLLGLGWFGSLLVVLRLAEHDRPNQPWRAMIPWAVLLSLLLASAVWLMAQPMEMRGTFLAG